MTGVLPDFSVFYDSYTGICNLWTVFLCLVGAPAIAAVLAREAVNLRVALRYSETERRASYVAHRESVCARLVRYTSAVNDAVSTPAIAVALAATVATATPVPVESRRCETIGQGCEGSAPVALDSLRPTSIIPCVVRGVCRYRDAATGRFVRCNAADLPV